MQPQPKATAKGKVAKSKKASTADVVLSKPGHRTCYSLLLAIAAHTRKLCIQRQINIIYGNPGVNEDCGRCSSCVEYPVPEPRPLPEIPEADVAIDQPGTNIDKTPKYMVPLERDLKLVGRLLEVAALRIRQMQPRHSDALLISSKCFLTETDIKSITRNFHLVVSKDILASRLVGWRYWNSSGELLWSVVKALVEDLRDDLRERREEANAKRRDTNQKKRDDKVHEELANLDLLHIKRVTLLLKPKEPRDTMTGSLAHSPSGKRAAPDHLQPAPKVPRRALPQRVCVLAYSAKLYTHVALQFPSQSIPSTSKPSTTSSLKENVEPITHRHRHRRL